MQDNKTVNGCAWGRETRIMVNNIEKSVGEIKGSIVAQNVILAESIKASSAKPSWFVTGLITTLGMLCCGLMTYLVTHPYQSHNLDQATHITQEAGS